MYICAFYSMCEAFQCFLFLGIEIYVRAGGVSSLEKQVYA